MIHANIIEALGPDPVRSDETLERCTNRLSSTDMDYFHRRAAQEAEAAHAASCSEARLAHEEMAEAYRLLCRSQKSGSDPHLASELSALLFHSRLAD